MSDAPAYSQLKQASETEPSNDTMAKSLRQLIPPVMSLNETVPILTAMDHAVASAGGKSPLLIVRQDDFGNIAAESTAMVARQDDWAKTTADSGPIVARQDDWANTTADVPLPLSSYSPRLLPQVNLPIPIAPTIGVDDSFQILEQQYMFPIPNTTGAPIIFRGQAGDDATSSALASAFAAGLIGERTSSSASCIPYDLNHPPSFTEIINGWGNGKYCFLDPEEKYKERQVLVARQVDAAAPTSTAPVEQSDGETTPEALAWAIDPDRGLAVTMVVMLAMVPAAIVVTYFVVRGRWMKLAGQRRAQEGERAV